ncbi:hypothetical protein L202_04534 [Cryptococcus amylolentus CBS 6039]|uniref:Uncharacterized protein n=1 Tax=Cryptococcus amylolentus CBS 6039 TaxID=1295533 RepID=A0A1E3HRP9_9TREE|nr:hypothetical protein L202_04534 [Cryptococcus amylolentus CBS 6039]ODN79029.1 hypothetical protein L202_04534 [Cryptococcus amylolentus CBS 6039]
MPLSPVHAAPVHGGIVVEARGYGQEVLPPRWSSDGRYDRPITPQSPLSPPPSPPLRGVAAYGVKRQDRYIFRPLLASTPVPPTAPTTASTPTTPISSLSSEPRLPPSAGFPTQDYLRLVSIAKNHTRPPPARPPPSTFLYDEILIISDHHKIDGLPPRPGYLAFSYKVYTGTSSVRKAAAAFQRSQSTISKYLHEVVTALTSTSFHDRWIVQPTSDTLL